MRQHRVLALGALILVLLSACSTGGSSKPTIKIGSDGFYESQLMAEIYAQALEANGYSVDRTGMAIGARKVSAAALESGQIDLKPEYIGSGLAYYEPGKQTGDPQTNQTELQAVLSGKGGGITVLDYTPAQDQNAFVVRADTAAQFHLSKMSDLTAVQGQLKFGVATDCPTNPVCAAAFKSAYGLDLSNATLLAACDTPMAQALLGKTIDVGELCTTQPDILVNGWVVLQDDKHTQPADNIAPLVRNDYLAKVDKASFEAILNGVSAKMDTATLASLDKQIAVDKKDIDAVATSWLKANGFVK
ncbi:MAG: glycine betaine ABC transporter substrate-binding protein [Candidatus Limnocylindrales bacterium]